MTENLHDNNAKPYKEAKGENVDTNIWIYVACGVGGVMFLTVFLIIGTVVTVLRRKKAQEKGETIDENPDYGEDY